MLCVSVGTSESVTFVTNVGRLLRTFSRGNLFLILMQFSQRFCCPGLLRVPLTARTQMQTLQAAVNVVNRVYWVEVVIVDRRGAPVFRGESMKERRVLAVALWLWVSDGASRQVKWSGGQWMIQQRCWSRHEQPELGDQTTGARLSKTIETR